MGRNHTPNCRTKLWTGAAGYKIYDPYCPECTREQKQNANAFILLTVLSLFMGLIGICCGVYTLIKGIT